MLRFQLRMVFSVKSRDEAVSVLRSLVGPVRSEPGCSATRLLMDVECDGALTWVEEWRSPAGFERHLQSPTFRSILAVMELAAARPEVEIDDVARRRGFEMVAETLARVKQGMSAEA
jgi:quinol monooxygenase YgiN